MEYRLKIKKTSIIIALLSLFSCGYMENDKIVYSVTIVNKFKLEQQGNSDAISLVYQNARNSAIIIIQDCNEVIFDSAKNVIYVQRLLNKYNSDYSSIELSLSSNNSSKPYILRSISKEMYEKKSARNKTIYSKSL